MHRQSLGSPSPRLPLHGGAAAVEEEKRDFAAGADVAAEDLKAVRWGSPKPERSIHLIPLLIILCIFILYLCSHDPSPKDLAGFGGGGALVVATKGVSGSIGAVRGHRKLKVAEKQNRRLSRKLVKLL